MQARVFAGGILVSLLAVWGGIAQGPLPIEKPLWTMEIIKVKPGMFGLALGYLDDNWMRVRDEAKRQGAVLNFHRIGEQSGSQNDGNIVPLTEYKNEATYDERQKLFDSIRKQLQKNTSGVLRPEKDEDLYSVVSTRVFQDFSDMNSARLRLLASD